MPYKSPEEVAEKVRGTEKLSEKQRRQFQHVFNSCWDEHGDEGKCHAMAWGAVKKEAYSVANKVDGIKPKRSSTLLAREILEVARDLIEGTEE